MRGGEKKGLNPSWALYSLGVFKRGASPSLQNVSPFPSEGKGVRGIGSTSKRDEI